MRKLMLVIPIFLLLTACGSNVPILVEIHTVPWEEMQEMCEAPNCYGRAKQIELPDGQIVCHIYILPEHEYSHLPIPENFYYDTIQQAVLGHEFGHCASGRITIDYQ